VIHLAWDLMIGMGTLLLLLAAWFGLLMWRRRDRLATSTWFLRAAVVAPLAAYLAIESGWIITEVGRQPWIVWQILRTEDAVTTTDAGVLWTMFGAIMVLYTGLAVGSVLVIRGLTRRWRAHDEAEAAP
jgi:cytochrome d ubiquinol oxidase subunit I